MGSLPNFAVLTLTDAAAARIREIVANATQPVAGVRVGVKNGGCAGMTYTLELAVQAVPGEDAVADKGVTVFVDRKAVLFLLGSVMDFEESALRSGFVFRNPNEVSACGCGESVQLKPAETRAG
ncbi:MAG: iron-sulfur cluster assembly accessory protein [Bauldia sp.]